MNYLLQEGLAGKVQQKYKGQEACSEIAGKHTKFAIVFFNSAFCLHMTYFLTFIRAGAMGQSLSPESLI